MVKRANQALFSFIHFGHLNSDSNLASSSVIVSLILKAIVAH